MRTTSIPHAERRARQASDSKAAHALARAGLTARGIIWILLGLVAVLVALGHSSHQADQQGALQLLAAQPYGSPALWLLAIGFAAYALWRLSEVAFGVAGEGRGAGPRLKSLGRAVIYAGFAYLTFKVLSGTASNQTRQQQDVTAKVMQHSGGRWLVGLAGLIILVVGLVLISEGVRRKFMKYLQTSQMSPRARRVVRTLGTIGTIARGVVIVLVGILVIDAAVSYSPAKAGGVDKALLTLRDQPFGPVLLFVVALGLIVFGVYGLAEARWRKV